MAMWIHGRCMGEPVTFLLQTPDGQPTDASAFLDAVCHMLQTETSVHAAARHVYRPLSVYVSLLGDPDAEPASTEDDMEALLDEWPLLYLALVMEHEEAAAAVLEFHQQHAVTVLEHILSENNRLALLRAAAEESTSFKCVGETHNNIMECQVVNELGGTIVLFTAQETGDAQLRSSGDTQHTKQLTLSVDANEPVLSVIWVTAALKPFLQCLLYERNHLMWRNTDAKTEEGKDSAFGFATCIVKAHCDALVEFYTRFPGIVVEYDVLYEVCNGNLVLLLDLLGAYSGLLLPVVRGTRIYDVGNNLHGSPAHSTGREASHGGSVPRSCCSQPAATPPFLLSFRPQEHQRLAFLVMWTNYREKASMERKLPGSARNNHEASVLSNFRVTLLNLKKSGYVVPSNSLWSGLIFVLSRLVSRECCLERFLDIIEEDNFAACSGKMPVTFIAALVAGAVVAAFFPSGKYMQLMCQKVEVLLVDVPGGASPLRPYILSQPANHTERFEGLWLAETPFSPARKFQSRAEMLYAALVDMVLCSAEKMWATDDAFPSSSESAKAQRSLRKWISMCRNFFQDLRDRPAAWQSGHTLSRASAEGEVPAEAGTASADDMIEEDESSVLQRVCQQMRLQLQQGATPLPAIYAALYTEGTAEAKTATDDGAASDDAGKTAAQRGVRDDFEAAQALFAAMAQQVNDDIKLTFYGLYKQATTGDVNVSKPWVMDFVGRAKWDAWNRLRGMSPDEAMRRYTAELHTLLVSGTSGSA
ncbi:putative acyl-CoA binding protein [Trypanosoma rangeli]|uniref:Putative acyl-CoA binding protein n=1 Tax=Trypanosoma rangeli TaxID=5698 RepID=A0A422N766_TRYRA|nr:putative acyl-CoA binding protein [Trypanosoma rangeli]RNF01282.1 putative acyl-CoA binding protein [Trypanosoma rangeli]|eukprot:RNF01282.1 putative acyl-CoA binding protein [Trypanosoma rangeli]